MATPTTSESPTHDQPSSRDPFAEAFKDCKNWIGTRYPQYAGDDWKVRSFSSEYFLSDYPDVVAGVANEAHSDNDEVRSRDFNNVIERAHAPEGYAFVTLQKGAEQVGFNVPQNVMVTEPGQVVSNNVVDVYALAQEIRRVDGKHDLGAAALAEALIPFLNRTISAS